MTSTKILDVEQELLTALYNFINKGQEIVPSSPFKIERMNLGTQMTHILYEYFQRKYNFSLRDTYINMDGIVTQRNPKADDLSMETTGKLTN